MKRRACTTKNSARSISSRCCFPGTPTIRCAAAQRLAGVQLGSDTPGPGLISGQSLSRCAQALSETEIARYRWLGEETVGGNRRVPAPG